MPDSQPCWHSFDDGRHWIKGRPSKVALRSFPGAMRIVFADAKPKDTQPELASA